MKVKRFFAASMQEALRVVREEMGADAVILSNTRLDDGVEIVAALDYEEESGFKPGMAELESSPEARKNLNDAPSPSQIARMHAEKHVQLHREMEKARRKIEQARAKKQKNERKRQADKSSSAASDSLAEMKSEIIQLQDMLKQQMSAADSDLSRIQKRHSLVQQKIQRKLKSLMIEDEILDSLIASVDDEVDFSKAWTHVRRQIAGAVLTEELELIDQGGIFALVGPTGSGKTMTIGKMAARYVLEYGNDSIALVTTDRYRIAAHEQLKVFGRILDIPVRTVDESHSLDDILDELEDKKLILIDTAGLTPSDPNWSQQLQEISLSEYDVRPYLVISAVGQAQVMRSNYMYYKMMGLAGCCITKVDEAVSLGELISFLIDSGLSAAYYTDGQRVPEDIHLMTTDYLLDKAEDLLSRSERWVSIHRDDSVHDTGGHDAGEGHSGPEIFYSA